MIEPAQAGSRRTQIVLVGGGHTHALVLLKGGRSGWGDAEVTLVSDVAQAPYSGMLAGHVAGHYSHEEMHIDLPSLCGFAGARLVVCPAVGLDPEGKRLFLADGRALSFDIASIDIGGSPSREAVPGAERWATPSKPVPALLAKWEEVEAAHRAGEGPRDVIVVGGGPGGVELSMAMRRRLGEATRIHLVHRDEMLLSGHSPRAGARMARRLRERGVEVILGDGVVEVCEDSVRCASGRRMPSQATFWITPVRPSAWLRECGVATDENGFVLVSPTLQSLSHPHLFAVGDVAGLKGTRVPKAGVIAVRQADPLYENIKAHLGGEPLQTYRPQKSVLSLIGMPTGCAMASRGWLVWESPLLWWLKKRIDGRFMRRFKRLPRRGTARDGDTPGT